MRHSNPYTNIAGINQFEYFFNRTDLVYALFDQLFSISPSCISIVGQRKIGKTSLLRHMMQPEIIQKFGYSPDNYSFVYIDCQLHQHRLRSADDFLSVMLEAYRQSATTQKSIVPQMIGEMDAKFETWIEIHKKLAKENLFLIFIFDEFDKVIGRETLHNDDLFGRLRALQQGQYVPRPHLAYVSSTQKTLPELFRQAWVDFNVHEIYKRSGSEFYNIMFPHVVDLFLEEETMELITKPSSEAGVNFSNEEIESIIEFGGNFPFFIQRACFYYFNMHLGHRLDKDSIRRQLLREALPLWLEFWDDLSEKEKKILSAIADKRETKSTDDDTMAIDPSLIYRSHDGKWRLFSKEFTRFVQSQGRPMTQVIKEDFWIDNNRYKVIEIVRRKQNIPNQVVKVWDERWEKTRAVKLLLTDEGISEIEKKNLAHILRREAEILVELSHPNIGKIYDIILDPVAIVMEWVEGDSLSTRIRNEKEKRCQKLSIQPFLQIAVQLADALIYIHSHEPCIVHRDISPNNVILRPDNSPKLIDFGIAKTTEYGTISRREDGSRFFVGNPEYSSPEQHVLIEEVGPPSDMFSLGMVLYELFTHRKPFTYNGDPFFYADHSLPQPDQLGLSNQLYDILCRMLSQEPGLRPSAETLKKELVDYSRSVLTE